MKGEKVVRVTTIENPRGLFVRFAYWMSRKRLGKVMTPLKAVYARIPKAILGQYGIARALEGGLTIDRELRF